jgi:Virulence protein
VQRPVTLYNLDAILAVGYRVRSPRGVQFRRWASTVLKEYLVKGFVMDDERLKNPDGRPTTLTRCWRASGTFGPRKSAFTKGARPVCLGGGLRQDG